MIMQVATINCDCQGCRTSANNNEWLCSVQPANRRGEVFFVLSDYFVTRVYWTNHMGIIRDMGINPMPLAKAMQKLNDIYQDQVNDLGFRWVDPPCNLL
jgi:hypothetical protein